MKREIRIGTAGWTLPSMLKPQFSNDGTHLERYARKLNCVEINSTFYREHKYETFVKWRDCTPSNFRFSVKLSKQFTHERRLQDCIGSLEEWLTRINGLGHKFEVLLVQIPGSFQFDGEVVEKFLKGLRGLYVGAVAWEPRHLSWASPEAIELFQHHQITKVSADPERCVSEFPNTGFRYWRLHGTPEIYRSRYSNEAIEELAHDLDLPSGVNWCIFDNTTLGCATQNALDLMSLTKSKKSKKMEALPPSLHPL